LRVARCMIVHYTTMLFMAAGAQTRSDCRKLEDL
jgi:hypothetical protein